MRLIVLFAHKVDCRCYVSASDESRKAAEPSVRVAAATNLVPVQTTELNWTFCRVVESAPRTQAPATGVGDGAGAVLAVGDEVEAGAGVGEALVAPIAGEAVEEAVEEAAPPTQPASSSARQATTGPSRSPVRPTIRSITISSPRWSPRP